MGLELRTASVADRMGSADEHANHAMNRSRGSPGDFTMEDQLPRLGYRGRSPTNV